MADVVNEVRRSTSRSRNEPVSLARRLASDEDREWLVRFRATRFRHEPISPGRPKRSRLRHRVFRNAPAPVARCGRSEVAGARLGLRGCSNLFTGRSNELLLLTGAWDSTT